MDGYTFLFNSSTQQANGLRYPLMGGIRQRHSAGTNLEPQEQLRNAPTPISRGHYPGALPGRFVGRP